MDDIVTDVNESWDENTSTRPTGMQQCVISTGAYLQIRSELSIYRFKGSDDYLRAKVCLNLVLQKPRSSFHF